MMKRIVAALVAVGIAMAVEGSPMAVSLPTAVASSPVVAVPAQPVDLLPGLTNFATVSADLYRGAQPTNEGFRALARMGVKTVVNLRAFHDDAKLLEGTGLGYVHITFEPWKPDPREVATFLKILTDPARRPVFVHCQHGADRTGTMVAAYRMVFQGWTLEQALAELPNFGFHRVWSNLKTFLRGLSFETLRNGLATGTGKP